MAEDKRGSLDLVQKYQETVLLYEGLDQEIDDLIMAHGGSSENMSPEELSKYRHLARLRDDVQNDMRALEHELRLDEE